MRKLENIRNLIAGITGIGHSVQDKIMISLSIIIIVLVLKKIIISATANKFKNSHQQYRFKKISAYVSAVLTIFVLGRVWFEGFSEITTLIGLFSAGLAIALKEMFLNVAGWIFILWRKPLEVGDRIEISGMAGDVIDIRLFQFTILEIGNWVDGDQSTGRIIHVPNGKVFNEPLASYTRGFHFIWNEINVRITFESNWKKAKEILLSTANAHAEHLSESAEKKLKEAAAKYLIFYTNLKPAVFTKVKESGIQLSVRYLCEPRKRRGSEQEIWEQVLDRFAEHDDIRIAYNTFRIYHRGHDADLNSREP